MDQDTKKYQKEFLQKIDQASSLADLNLIIKEHYRHLQDNLEEKNQDILQKIDDYLEGKIDADGLPEKHGLRDAVCRLKEE